MSALKKTSVSVMIMLVCIILAVVIGEARKPFYENVSHDGTVVEQSIGQDLYEMTTFGKISQAVYDVVHSADSTEVNDTQQGVGIVGLVILAVIIILVLKLLGGNRRD